MYVYTDTKGRVIGQWDTLTGALLGLVQRYTSVSLYAMPNGSHLVKVEDQILGTITNAGHLADVQRGSGEALN